MLSATPSAMLTEHRSRPLPWLKNLAAALGSARALGLASEMAFWLFLSLLPLAAVAGLAAARLALDDRSVVAPLLASLPPATRELLSGELANVAAWNGGKVGVGAAAVFLWLASSGVHSIFDGLELETESAPRPWWKKRALALVTCLGLSVGLAAITLLTTGISWFWGLAGKALPDWMTSAPSALFPALRVVVGLLLGVGLVTGLYRIGIPGPACRRMPHLPGAALAVVLQVALGLGYGAYIRHMGDGGAYQAGLATIGVTMTALYLCCLSLLVGAEVNQALGEPSGQPTSGSPSPSRGPRLSPVRPDEVGGVGRGEASSTP